MYSSRIIIPSSLRSDIIKCLHEGHQGITKCPSLAQQSVWWPGLSTQLEQVIKNCVVFIKYQPDKIEPLMPSEFPQRPWQVVGTDLLKLQGHWYLIVADYYSRYMEVAKLEPLTPECVITQLKSCFARHGVPEVLRSDNGTQFLLTVGSAYQKFAQDYGFSIITSSPRYPQSNGFIETEVKNFKNHFKKCEDPYKMLLALRTTPLANGYSPSELLMGRKLRGLVPISSSQLCPAIPDTRSVQEKEERRKAKQNINDKRHKAVVLPELNEGQKVWVSDLRQQATVEKKHSSPRSYLIRSRQGIYRRNRKFLHPIPDEVQESSESDVVTEIPEDSIGTPKGIEQEATFSIPSHSQPSPTATPVRRSTRTIKPPIRLNL